MGMSYDAKVALVFDDEDAAIEMQETLEAISNETSVLDRYLKDSHCDGAVGTPIYDIEWQDNVVRFSSSGYGTYDLSCLRMTAKTFASFKGWVQQIGPCQSQDTWIILDNDVLYNPDDTEQYDFYDRCTPLEEWDYYPQQSDFQTMEDDEVIDDEEAFEEACCEFRNDVYDKLSETFEEIVIAYGEES